ncbi:unnamed protein product [Chrysoparadoxa australica]
MDDDWGSFEVGEENIVAEEASFLEKAIKAFGTIPLAPAAAPPATVEALPWRECLSELQVTKEVCDSDQTWEAEQIQRVVLSIKVEEPAKDEMEDALGLIPLPEPGPDTQAAPASPAQQAEGYYPPLGDNELERVSDLLQALPMLDFMLS